MSTTQPAERTAATPPLRVRGTAGVVGLSAATVSCPSLGLRPLQHPGLQG